MALFRNGPPKYSYAEKLQQSVSIDARSRFVDVLPQVLNYLRFQGLMPLIIFSYSSRPRFYIVVECKNANNAYDAYIENYTPTITPVGARLFSAGACIRALNVIYRHDAYGPPDKFSHVAILQLITDCSQVTFM